MADYQKMYAVLCGAIDEVIPFWNAFHRRSPAPARSARRWNRQKHSTLRQTKPRCACFRRRMLWETVHRHKNPPGAFTASGGVYFQRFDQTRREPAGILSSSITRFSLSPRSAESSIPQDSCPIILRGGRFVTATSVLPSSSSGL